MLAAGAPCGAQSPASSAPASSAPGESATSSAKPSSSTASSSATAPATVAAETDSTATAADSKPASSETAASSEPSPEVLKEARREGFKPKKRDGVTKFCYTDATLGTRFETEKCFDQHHMEALVQQREDQRNLLRQPGACTGSACGGH
jgi:hypothetical protein